MSELNFDPRPDLSDDSWLWDWLLKRLSGEEQILFHGFRCAGFRFRQRDGQVVMEPTVLPGIGFSTFEEYREFRESWMVPNAAVIQGTLQKIADTFSAIDQGRIHAS